MQWNQRMLTTWTGNCIWCKSWMLFTLDLNCNKNKEKKILLRRFLRWPQQFCQMLSIQKLAIITGVSCIPRKNVFCIWIFVAALFLSHIIMRFDAVELLLLFDILWFLQPFDEMVAGYVVVYWLTLSISVSLSFAILVYAINHFLPFPFSPSP